VTRTAAAAVARALLYEGYLLYPYRPTAGKNQYRFTFGNLVPEGCVSDDQAERCACRTECLVRADERASIDLELRFLQIVERAAPPADERAPAHGAPAPGQAAWQEAIDRLVTIEGAELAALAAGARSSDFVFSSERGRSLCGRLELSAEQLDQGLYKLSATARNLGRQRGGERSELLMTSLVSAHKILVVRGGEFVSLLDPPPALAEHAAACRNQGTWPVLAGDHGRADVMLSSPIILYDHPRVAPESAGDLFDATEIDEILSLRILTLSDDEKRELRACDPRARAILERTEGLSEKQLIEMHGTLRDPAAESAALADLRTRGVSVSGVLVKPGDVVRLQPRAAADAFDLVLRGKLATVQSIEQDVDDVCYVTVTVNDDPGRDLGAFGHRFFFRTDEVEPL
jgi:hypothetical protein